MTRGCFAFLLALASLCQGCESQPPDTATAAPRVQIITMKVTKVERSDREINHIWWDELRFVAMMENAAITSLQTADQMRPRAPSLSRRLVRTARSSCTVSRT